MKNRMKVRIRKRKKREKERKIPSRQGPGPPRWQTSWDQARQLRMCRLLVQTHRQTSQQSVEPRRSLCKGRCALETNHSSIYSKVLNVTPLIYMDRAYVAK